MISKTESYQLLRSLNTPNADIKDVTDFTLQIIYNKPRKEKSPTDSRYAMIYVGKGSKKKFVSTKQIPPDTQSLLQKIKQANLVSYTYYHCLDNGFVPLNPINYGWKIEGLNS